MVYIIPALLLITFIIAVIKKINIFDSFTEGIKEALKLVINILPYLAAIFIALELMRASGLSGKIGQLIAPALSLFGIPPEIAELLILRPLSGSGSLVVLEEIYKNHGVDSYIGRVASVIMGATDTILYVSAVYFSSAKDKKTGLAIPISLFASLAGTVAACLLLKFM